MPRNDANNSNIEAESLPILITNKQKEIVTTTTNIIKNIIEKSLIATAAVKAKTNTKDISVRKSNVTATAEDDNDNDEAEEKNHNSKKKQQKQESEQHGEEIIQQTITTTSSAATKITRTPPNIRKTLNNTPTLAGDKNSQSPLKVSQRSETLTTATPAKAPPHITTATTPTTSPSTSLSSFSIRNCKVCLRKTPISKENTSIEAIFENSDVENDSESNSNPNRRFTTSLYPAVIETTGVGDGRGGGGGGGISVIKSSANSLIESNPSKSNLSVILSTGASVAACTTLCSKLPAFLNRKRNSRFKRGASIARDQNRLATLRTRKNPLNPPPAPPNQTPIADNKKNKSSPPFKKQSQQQQHQKQQQKKQKQKQQQERIFKKPHLLDAADLNKIEVLEFEESRSGAGTSGGTKRKRNNSLTAATLATISALTGVSPRKRAATFRNNINHNSLGGEQKGGSNVSSTNSNMSLYERRYQTATAANSSDDNGRVVGTSNGYLSSTRSSSASSGVLHTSSDNGIGDVPMETQYYLSGGTSATSSLLTAGSSLSNGGSGGVSGGSTTTISTINHAPSMATLCNIGNSCYLNSVVYTLRFAPRFLHNLHHLIVDLATVQQNIVRHRAKSASLGRGMNAAQLESSARSWSSKDLASLEQYNSSSSVVQLAANGSNNNVSCSVASAVVGGGGDICKSRHQLLTEKLHELYQSLHRNEVAESTEPHHADKLLHAIQDVSTIFEGNQQQDAHEFLMCVLNSIRETCQTLIKLIADCPELITEGNIIQVDDIDGNERDGFLNATTPSSMQGNIATIPQMSSSSLSTSNFTKTSFFSRKSKRKEEAKSAKNFRLQSPLKDATSNSSQQQQAIANSHFYLNSVDLSGIGGSGAILPASSPTSAIAPSSTLLLSNSSSSDTTDAIGGGGKGGLLSGAAAAAQPLGKQRLAEKIRELGLDFFSEDFEGITVATTKCLSCETITEQKESMIDIAVPVPISGYDSTDYTEKPSSFIQNSCITREYFRGENKYRCEQCTGYTEAIRSISYEVLPRLLVIQLSRFSGGMEKINSYIPTSFTLQCFCSKCCELSDANKLHVYKLYSVITHVGATMSVGHYIAYTCSLDWADEYTNCPKDRRTAAVNKAAATAAAAAAAAQQQQTTGNQSNGSLQQQQIRDNNITQQHVTATQTSAASAAASALASSGTSLMKKMKFGRSKASSSGDISKNLKNLNGMTSAAAAAVAAAANSQTITNGISKLSMNTTCHSLNCCATRLSTVQHQQQQQHVIGLTDLSEESMQNGANHNAASLAAAAATAPSSINPSTILSSGSFGSYSSGYGSTGRGGTKSTPYAASSHGSEPIWYMCDDDKIKAMTQREFEELLSPSRKITITPYLLFYARIDLQPSSSSSSSATTSAAAAAAATSSSATVSGLNQSALSQTQAAMMSWASESLQSGGGGIGSLQKI